MPESVSPQIKDMTIVDADAHIMEREDDLLPYVRDVSTWAAKMIEHGDSSTIQSLTRPGPLQTGIYESDSDDVDVDDIDAAPVREKLREMEDFGIDYGITSPTMLISINTINNPEIAHAYRKGYNLWLQDNFLGTNDRLKASVLVSRHYPKKAAEEIDRMADEDDIAAITLNSPGLSPPLGDPMYDPIYQAAVDNDLPILLHAASGAFQWDFSDQYKNAWSHSEGMAFANPFQQMWQFVSSFSKGLPARFPDIKLVFQEAGIGWIPYMKWRMDDKYIEQTDDFPYLEKFPSEYLESNYYFTTQSLGHTRGNPDGIAKMIEFAGADQIMFSSDLPHATFDTPNELFDRINPHLDSEVVEKVMGGTAKELFGL